MITVCRNMTSSSRIITEVVAYDVLRHGIVILNYKSHDLTLALAERAATFPDVDYVCVVDDAASDDFAGDFSNPKIHYIKS